MAKSDGHLCRDVVIANELGLHARSAAQIARCARNSRSNIWLIKDEDEVDASSTLDVLTLACGIGSTLTIRIDDPLDQDILDDLVKLIESGFED